MWKKFCRWYLYRHLGWKTNVTVNHPEKFIICLAPHTSNWDFIVGKLFYTSMPVPKGCTPTS